MQLEKTIEFISKHNKHFLGKKEFIRNCILQMVHDLVVDPEGTWVGTMGFVVSVQERIVEDLDNDNNYVSIEFLVDPALCEDTYTDEDYHIEDINVSGIKDS